jgi:cytosine/adenosine deaminase-related metal-dependent hydrolase/ubiquinone/menaquinone biosynthesis C-methylase UbiE
MAELANNTKLRDDFALWSHAYDTSPNPMLALEERYLARILPPLDGKDVLDVGCGTGRWLKRLAVSPARSLTGIDFSPEMLARAAEKLDPRVVLALGNATSLPIAACSADVVLASFVASYVWDLDAFAAELWRVGRPASTIYVSDVHAETAAACNWKRAFHAFQYVELTARERSIQQVISGLQNAGFVTKWQLELPFELPDLETFRQAGKLDAFYAAAGRPGIYILEMQRARYRAAGRAPQDQCRQTSITDAQVALDADAAIEASIDVSGTRIVSMRSSRQTQSRTHSHVARSLRLDGYLLLPGLINAHDHLEFGLYPNLGRGSYADCAEWARDIQENESAIICKHQSIPRDVRLWWGAIRNLLCGVTTVCHHNPLYPELLSDDFPVRVVTNFGWAHSPAMDAELDEKFKKTPADAPFVVHACEGLDDDSAKELLVLDEGGLLGDRTILVHGLALDAAGVALLNCRGAALVCCPSSNRFLFGRTHDRATITSVRRLLLGSDSPLTAVGTLLDEVRIAHRELGISARDLYEMLSARAAHIFRLSDGEGSLRPNGIADLIAVRDMGLSPAETLARLSMCDIEMVMVRGRVQLASPELLQRLPPDLCAGLQALEIDSALRWVRAPLARLFRQAERVLGSEIKISGKRVLHVGTA